MLRITEKTPTRLVLRDQRKIGAFVAGIFTTLACIAVLLVIVQGIESFGLDLQDTGELNPLQVFTFAMFVSFGLFFVGVGAMTVVNFGRGMTFVLDKAEEVMRLQRVGIFKMRYTTHSIYSISHIDIDTNTDVRAYGLFLVLRSGERIPLTSIPMIDEDHMEDTVKQVRQFLRA